ncbi:MAG: threonine synthase [Candidatus Polarisedimenticolia bacterium]
MPSSRDARFLCDLCGAGLTDPPPLWRCPCGGPLSVQGPRALDPRALAGRPPSLWRYREAMALDPGIEPITLGEGMTPVVLRQVAGLEALFKLEMLNPTGSFKDRGACVVASEMRARGVRQAVEDSSGNAGAALAAYGSRAGIEMQIVAPEGAPAPKLMAITGAGGHLTCVPGGRAAAGEEALRRAASGMEFASHLWNPWFMEGTRTFAYEVWEQTEGRLPERVFFPVGNGSLLIGAASGFDDLVAWSLASRSPRLMAVQALACAPLVPGAPAPGATVADGIRIPAPPRARRMRAVVEASGGAFTGVSEAEILEARAALGRAGLAVEPTSAVAFAGALAWCRSRPGEPAPLVALTGTGLKVP